MVIEKKAYKQVVTDILRDLSKRSPLTDTNIGSVTRTIVETVGLEIASLYDQLEAAYHAGFVDTAEGPAMDLVVAILGLSRKTAQFATGSVTFSRRNANRDVTIPRGTRVSTRTADPTKVKVFETTMTAQLPKGEHEVEAPVRALLPGEDGEADLETITDIDSPIVGVEKVVNKKPTNVGAEEEKDEEFRERAKGTVLSAGKTTVYAIYNAVLSIPGVRSVNVYDMPNGIPGEIDVIVDGLDLTDPESVEYMAVQEVITQHRPVGIQVNVKSVEVVKVDLEIYTKLYEKTRTDDELEDVIVTIENAVVNYINALKAGEPVLKNRIIQSVVNVEDVYNIDDIIISTKVFDEKLGGMLDDTRHRVDANTKDIRINPEERATIDNLKIITQYTPRLVSYVQIDLNVDLVPAHKTVTKRQVQNRIESAIHVHIERLKSGEEVDYKRIFNIIANIDGVLELRKFTIDALHEETGLIVKNAEENIKIFEDETPKLRDVNLEFVEITASSAGEEGAKAEA